MELSSLYESVIFACTLCTVRITDEETGLKSGSIDGARNVEDQTIVCRTLTLLFYYVSFSCICRSDIAWKNAKYAQIWEYLRDEFELTQRFASLDFKLKFVEVPLSCLLLYLVSPRCHGGDEVTFLLIPFAAQHSVSSGNPSESEIGLPRMAHHRIDWCRDSHLGV